MPQLVSTDTWFPVDYVRRNLDANGVEYLLAFDRQCQFDMVMVQLVWAKASIENLTQLGKVFDAAVSKSPATVRQAILHHWLEAVVVAVAATEEYLAHITTGIERLQGSIDVLMSSEELLVHHSQLQNHQLASERLWIEFRMDMNLLARKVDDVCLKENFPLFNPKLTPTNALRPGTILQIVRIPAEQKRSFFLEAVELWRQMQNLPNNNDIPEFGIATTRLLRLTENIRETASYQTEAEAAAAQSAAADPQNPIPATERSYGPEEQAKEAAGGDEIGVKLQSLSTVTNDQDGHAVLPENPTTVMGDDDGHAPIGNLLDSSFVEPDSSEDGAVWLGFPTEG